MIKFALIGCGRIAQRHAENIIRLGELVAVCDIIPEKAEKFSKDYGATAYYTLEELLKKESDVDVISICTPNGFHAEHSIKSLQAGKHVFCEKPLCLTSAAAWQIIETEKFTRRKLFVVKSARYNSLLMQLKKIVDDGTLGKLYSYQLSCFWNRSQEYYNDWHGKNFPDGGTLYTQFSHYIDAALWLFGDVEEVSGFTCNVAHQNTIEFEDTGVAALQMKNGMLGTLNWSVNTFKKNCEVALTVIAENGTIILGGEYLNEIKYKEPSTLPVENFSSAASDHSIDKSSMSNHQQMYDNLVMALKDKDHPFTNAYDGLKTVETIEKIYKAVSFTLSPQA